MKPALVPATTSSTQQLIDKPTQVETSLLSAQLTYVEAVQLIPPDTDRYGVRWTANRVCESVNNALSGLVAVKGHIYNQLNNAPIPEPVAEAEEAAS